MKRVLLWICCVVATLPVAVVVVVLIAGNLGFVRRIVESETPALTGGMVHIAGLHGRFPDALRLDHVEVADVRGAWLRADEIVLDWSPLALVGWTAKIDAASIGHLSVVRLPVPGKAAAAAKSGGSFRLPVRLDVAALRIARADFAAPVVGTGFAVALQGRARMSTLQDGAADITVTRLDGAGDYHVDGAVHPGSITAHVSVREPAGGLIAAAGKLQGLGAISVTALIDGPRSAEQAQVAAAAGDLHATLSGFADLPGKRLALDVVANAPAMHPRADVSWRGIDLKAHVSGPFTTPNATGHLSVTDLQADGAGVADLQADLAGDSGRATVHAVVAGLRVPGKQPDLFAAAPVDVRATVNLAAADRPAEVRIAHPLLAADLHARTVAPEGATLHALLPDLAPLAAAAGIDVRGRSDISVAVTTEGVSRHIAASGVVTIDGGATLPAGLRGDTKLDVAAVQTGNDIALPHATLEGREVHLDASGTAAPDRVALQFNAVVPNIAAFAPQAEGALTAAGSVSGVPGNLKVVALVTGDAGAPRYGKGPVLVRVNATNVPAAPHADIDAKVFLAGANAVLHATSATDEQGTIHAVVQRGDWKSVRVRADVVTQNGDIPAGKIAIDAGNLGDFNALTGQALSGSLHGVLTTTETDATVTLNGRDLAAGPRRIARLGLAGRATGVQSDPDITGTLTLDGIDAEQVTGNAKLTAQGRAAALQLRAAVDLENVQGAPVTLTSSALLDARAKQATLQTLRANWKTIALRLQGASRVEFGRRVAVDRLVLAVNAATLEMAGQFAPALNFTASLRNVTPDLARAVVPGLNASGVLTADARVTGAAGAPAGTIRLRATGLRNNTGPAASLPAATVAANVTMAGAVASIDAHVDAGAKLHLAATGTAPLRAGGALAVRTTGHLDLTLLNPVLEAGGRQAKGTAVLDLTATGSLQAPRAGGSVTLANADIQDFAQGLHLDKINGRVDASGDTITITRLTAGAGPGSISLDGTVGITQPGVPVDLRVTARNARPLASDLLTATFDADLTVRGQASGIMDAGGSVTLRRMDINIPDSLPPSVAVLNVRRPGYKPPAAVVRPPAPVSVVRLAIDVDAPSSIFVRGKGLNAELAGKLAVHGTSGAPLIEGGFELRRGDFSLAGTSLTFGKGDVSFNGAGLDNRIDPTLDFEADSYSGNITATLKITGYADAPKISLSSVPDLPQDEVLAHLLFGQSMSQLSALQIAEIGAALAEISGLTGGGEGPLGAIRKNLGLDRLSVGGGSGGAGTTIEAGRYVAKGVYVGTKQTTSGAGGTQAEVQIDLTRRLKLNSTLGGGGGTAQGATPDNDPGTSIGLSYGFEY